MMALLQSSDCWRSEKNYEFSNGGNHLAILQIELNSGQGQMAGHFNCSIGTCVMDNHNSPVEININTYQFHLWELCWWCTIVRCLYVSVEETWNEKWTPQKFCCIFQLLAVSLPNPKLDFCYFNSLKCKKKGPTQQVGNPRCQRCICWLPRCRFRFALSQSWIFGRAKKNVFQQRNVWSACFFDGGKKSLQSTRPR